MNTDNNNKGGNRRGKKVFPDTPLSTGDAPLNRGETAPPQNLRSGGKARESRQLRYLAQSVRLEEAVAPKVVKISIAIISIAVIAFLFWASLTRVEEIARVEGEITPIGFQQVVQHLEGGIVRDIMVDDGDIVEEGDILLRLVDVNTKKDLERTEKKLLNLKLQRIRFNAKIKGQKPDYSDFIFTNAEEVANQLNIYNASIDAERKERRVLEEQIAQRLNAIDSLKLRMRTTGNNYKIAEKLYETRKNLAEEGIISEVRFLETRQRLNDLKGEMENIQNQIVTASFALDEFQKRLESLDASNRDEDYKNLEKVEQEIVQTEEVLAKLRDRARRLDVRAPTKGIVKGMEINTIGSVIQPGQLIMEIVPLDKELVSIIRIPPDNIGYINIGDRVKLKVSTFDFSRYGTVPGELEFISATTFTNEEGSSFYEGRVVLERDYVGEDPDNRVLPGMTVIADIIIGRKTIMQYLLKPIHQSLKTAFTER